MTPAPITTIFLGTLGRSSAPVLSTTIPLSLLTSTPGSEDGTEPEAITMFLVS